MNLQIIKLRVEARKFHGGIKGLAETVGMTEQNLHRCVRENKIQAQDLEKIAKALNVSVLEFFDEAQSQEEYYSPASATLDVNDDRTVNKNIHMANLLKIKDLAERQKVSIRELADRVGLRENQIHVMCRTNSTKIDTLEKIAKALNVSVIEFFDEAPKTVVHTEGDYSPASRDGDVSVVVGDAVLAVRVKALEALVAEKDERIKELKERIEELKSK
ncbi:MAG: helix-turn-helix domain-containing protein [Muribaculaceae bacterium]